MNSIRIPDTIRGYTVIPNGLLPEGRISARSWGIYTYLLGRPPGWECRVAHLRTVFTEGRDAIYTALGDLVDVGLLVKESYRDDSGMPRQRYALADTSAAPVPENPDPENPNPEKPGQVTTETTITTEDSQLGGDAATKPAPKRRHQLPDDFRPTDGNLELARELGVDLRAEWPQFVDHHRGRGTTMKDWSLALNTWIRNAAKWGRGGKTVIHPGGYDRGPGGASRALSGPEWAKESGR